MDAKEVANVVAAVYLVTKFPVVVYAYDYHSLYRLHNGRSTLSPGIQAPDVCFSAWLLLAQLNALLKSHLDSLSSEAGKGSRRLRYQA